MTRQDYESNDDYQVIEQGVARAWEDLAIEACPQCGMAVESATVFKATKVADERGLLVGSPVRVPWEKYWCALAPCGHDIEPDNGEPVFWLTRSIGQAQRITWERPSIIELNPNAT